MDFEQHLKIDHEELGEPFMYFQESTIRFNDEQTVSSINLINAFSRKFVLFYRSDVAKRMTYFIIFLLGRKSDAENYLINFEILSKDSKYRKVNKVLLL